MATPTQIKRRGRLSLILGTLVAAIAFAALAYADVVTVNDVVTGSDTALTRGATSTAAVSIAASNTDPAVTDASGCNATGSTPATVTLNTNSANVSVNAPTSKSYSGCGNVETFGYSVSSTASLGSLTVLSTSTTGGKAGSLYREDSFTVRVLPRPPSNLLAGADGASEIDLTWTASPDAADITDYKIYEGAVEVGTAAKNATNVSITGLSPGSTHCYTIKARYNDGSADWFSTAVGGIGAACATTLSDSTPPVITKVVSGTLGAGGWYTSDVTVAWTITDGESAVVINDGCGTQIFTAETMGVTASCSATSAGGTSSDSVIIKIDKTGPTAGLAVTAGTLGSNGWYTSNVTVATSGADSISGPVTCTADQFQTAETTGTAFNGSCTNQAGLTTNAAVLTVKLDKTGPTAGLAVTAGTLGSNGWYTSNVTVTTSGVDTISSPVTCTANQFQTTDTAGTTFNGSCTNDAGLTTNATPLTVKLDKTPPGLTWNGSINDGDSYYFGFVPAAPTCTASDDLSGPDGCNVTGYSSAVGSHTLTATAKDQAGNQTVQTRGYTVLAWTLTGFFQPVDMGSSVWNTVKNGSTVPLKFRVFAGSLELTDPAIVNQLKATLVSCSSGTEDAIEELAAAGGTSLRYDATGSQFVYNWQTPKQLGKCYRVTVGTADGSSLVANFKLK